MPAAGAGRRPARPRGRRVRRAAPREPRRARAVAEAAHDRASRRPTSQVLEAEAIHIIREVAAELEKPVLLFSGGKDSIVLLRLAEKAFRPAAVPVPGHARRHGPQLPRGDRVPRPPRRGARRAADRRLGAGVDRHAAARSRRPARAPRATGCRPSTLLDAIEEHGFDAAFGGARRDEERARAKERIFSFRDDFGQWDPRRQRPELWNLYNGRIRTGEHVRVFPLSNWTELDVWQYIAREELELPVDLLRPRARGLRARRDALRGRRDFVAADGRRGAVHASPSATAPSAT